jgi:uncharacterized protein with NRDE domain
MCLLSLAWQAHPDYPLVFLGNRDEYHARPTAPADWWQEFPNILGGRDLEAGGSWLGVNRQGRFAVVTNRPDLPAPEENPHSRGELVTAWLGDETNISAIDLLSERASSYGGFSLLLADRSGLTRLSGGHGVDELETKQLEPGVSGLSNTAPDDPWPKLTWLNAELEQLVAAGEPDHATLMELLLGTKSIGGGSGVASTPFVLGERYGTRSSSVITVTRAGECHFTERRFGPLGKPAGESAYFFKFDSPA